MPPTQNEWTGQTPGFGRPGVPFEFVPSVPSAAGLSFFFFVPPFLFLSDLLMVSLFYARRYPAGREFKRDQPVPNGERHSF